MPTRRTRGGASGAPIGSAARAWNYLRNVGSRASRAAAGRAYRATSYLANMRRGSGSAGGSGSSGG